MVNTWGLHYSFFFFSNTLNVIPFYFACAEDLKVSFTDPTSFVVVVVGVVRVLTFHKKHYSCYCFYPIVIKHDIYDHWANVLQNIWNVRIRNSTGWALRLNWVKFQNATRLLKSLNKINWIFSILMTCYPLLEMCMV